MKRHILLLLFNLFVFVASAQTFTAQTSSNKVAVGQRFQISYTLNGAGSNFTLPSLKDFDVYSGPNQSNSFSIVNGNMSQSITLSYIIAAKHEGTFTIEPATVVINGNTVKSNKIIIEVTKDANNAKPKDNRVNSGTGGDNIFVKSYIDNSKVFQGEQVIVTHKVYSRFQIININDVKFPDYNGFWVQEEENKNKNVIQVYNENIDGTVYQVAEIKKTYLFPQHSGTFKIKPVEVECTIRRQSTRPPRDIFEHLLGGGYEDVAVKLKGNPIALNVISFPEKTKATGFKGITGDYSIKTNLSKDKVKENEAINLKVTISGTGNLKLIDAPDIEFPNDFETYDPKLSEKISISQNRVVGTKTFDYLIVPRHAGDYKITATPFIYFNPETKKYVEVPFPEFNIEVEKGEGDTPAITSFNIANKQEVEMLGNDIRHIKTNDNIEWKDTDDSFFGSSAFYMALITPVFAFLTFMIIYKKRKEEEGDVVTAKSKKANRVAKKKLAIAEKYLNSNDKEMFYSEILKALFGYIGDKFNIPLGNLNKEQILHVLNGKQVNKELINQFIETIDKAEYAKYAPIAVSGDLQAVYKSTIELISNVEDELKKL